LYATKFTKEETLTKIKSFDGWYHKVEVAPGVVTPGTADCLSTAAKLQLTEDCTGMRVLDLGASDGYYSILLKKRGAREVIAIDHRSPEKTGFPILKELYGVDVEYYTDSVYNISPEKYGTFDIVLCLGVLYHLRNPLLLLDRIREVCTSQLYVESHAIDNYMLQWKEGKPFALSKLPTELTETPVMQFYVRDEFHNDPTNWWGPNLACLERMLESANFTVIHKQLLESRAFLKCKINNDPDARHWREVEHSPQWDY
jgi:tRNA (mo5U34)-methyltransferase